MGLTLTKPRETRNLRTRILLKDLCLHSAYIVLTNAYTFIGWVPFSHTQELEPIETVLEPVSVVHVC
jgi:hypothetical protein